MARPKNTPEIKEESTKTGKTVYKVSRVVNGRQIRKSFKSHAEAETFLDSLIQEEARIENKAKIRLTRLSEEELRSAENACELLRSEGHGVTLFDAAKFYTGNFQEELVPVTFQEIEMDFRNEHKSKWKERVRRDYKNLLHRLKNYFRNKKLHQIKADDLLEFIESGSDEPLEDKTWNNYKGSFNRIFDWAASEDRRYCKQPTPASKLPFYKVYYGAPEVLEVDQARDLMAFAEEFRGGEIANIIALMLFAGIRPGIEQGEIFKLCLVRTERRHLDVKTGRIYLSQKIAKTSRERTILMRPNLKEWLTAYSFATYPPFPDSLPEEKKLEWLNYRVKKFRERCPVKLGHDVLRHSFSTYRAVGETTLIHYLDEAGHSEEIARAHYLGRATEEEAKAFWSISPKKK